MDFPVRSGQVGSQFSIHLFHHQIAASIDNAKKNIPFPFPFPAWNVKCSNPTFYLISYSLFEIYLKSELAPIVGIKKRYIAHLNTEYFIFNTF